MQSVVTNQQMKHMDQYTINELGVPGIVLMENAGYQSSLLIEKYGLENGLNTVFIITGKGNNGGDGFVIARHLHKRRFHVTILALATGDDLQGDALVNFRICEAFKIPIRKINSKEDFPVLPAHALVIDALLGTGIKGAVRGFFKDTIEWMNKQDAPIIAIDMPSGLNGNSAEIEGAAVRADMTLTMALPKCGQLFYPSRSHVGSLHVVDIGMPEFVEKSKNVHLHLVTPEDIAIPEPDPWQNKYSAGTVFILAGSPGMTGAAVMAARAAGVTGAGLIYVGIPAALNTILESKLTEPLTLPLPDAGTGILENQALPLICDKIDWCDAFLIGPGMGRHPSTLEVIRQAVLHALEKEKPTVIDADALFLLSRDPELCKQLTERFILTPHYGEFIRLSGHSKHEMRATPWKAFEEFLKSHACTVNLKGAPSMAGSADKGIFINPTGNSGLAKGGSGDILAGLIAGFLARGMEPLTSAVAGNFMHGKAGDMALSDFDISGYQPTDLIMYLKRII